MLSILSPFETAQIPLSQIQFFISTWALGKSDLMKIHIGPHWSTFDRKASSINKRCLNGVPNSYADFTLFYSGLVSPAPYLGVCISSHKESMTTWTWRHSKKHLQKARLHLSFNIFNLCHIRLTHFQKKPSSEHDDSWSKATFFCACV